MITKAFAGLGQGTSASALSAHSDISLSSSFGVNPSQGLSSEVPLSPEPSPDPRPVPALDVPFASSSAPQVDVDAPSRKGIATLIKSQTRDLVSLPLGKSVIGCLSDHKTCDTPLDLNVKFWASNGELLVDPTLFRKLGLFLSSTSQLTLLAFSNAYWAGDVTDRQSTTGNSIFSGHTLISWRSKKQSIVSCSSTEAEYHALADIAFELVWFRWLLQDMSVHLDSSTPLPSDNN
ncbi:hypothetical protein H6P81_002554 [Aristolochia fimbriata]|uniref:Uncharacterized protein n=1 Tax=Aristolochia fimbriata TaxID=158543 RepID=A0AAV7FB91_ARIFI|nr:hypothetical protein H6P81_002554 [Aristolochia fimbriata]